MGRFAPRLTLRVVPALVVVVAAAVIVAAVAELPQRPPQWLVEAARAEIGTYIGPVEPTSVTYHLGDRRHHAVYRFGRVVACRVCSTPAGAPGPSRGDTAQPVFDAKTQRRLTFAFCTSTRWCIHPAGS